jgi:hypothetical protein
VPMKAGAKLRSATDSTEVVVVRAPREDVELRCGGHPMRPVDGAGDGVVLPLDPGFTAGTQLGKRYTYDPAGLELLCTKPGQGALSVGTQVLPVKAARSLPSSD